MIIIYYYYVSMKFALILINHAMHVHEVDVQGDRFVVRRIVVQHVCLSSTFSTIQ